MFPAPTVTFRLAAYHDSAGHSTMARTVGVPCSIMTQLILDEVLSTPGVHAPYTKETCDPIQGVLERGRGSLRGYFDDYGEVDAVLVRETFNCFWLLVAHLGGIRSSIVNSRDDLELEEKKSM
jgi:Saccharopine dehydrogenase C-terminal domain